MLGTGAVQAQDLLILGARGEVLRWNPQSGAQALTPLATLGEIVLDWYVDEDSGTVFVSTLSGNVYALSVDRDIPGYAPVAMPPAQPLYVLFDEESKRPGRVALTNGYTSHVVILDDEGAERAVALNHLRHPNLQAALKGMPGSMVSTADLQTASPALAAQLTAHADASWALSGRSRTLEVYAKEVLDLTPDGETVRATVLAHDLTTNAWRLFDLDEAAEIRVYDGAALIRGMTDLKGDRGADGFSVPPKPSGAWHVLRPGSDTLLSTTLDPTLRALYATEHAVIFARQQEIVWTPLAPDGFSPSIPLLTLPVSLPVFAAYLLNAEPISVPENLEEHGRSVGRYVLVSADEQAEPPQPVRIYRTNRSTPRLSLLAEIPASQGIRQASAYPQLRKLAIWRNEAEDAGSLLIVDVDVPQDQRIVAFPFNLQTEGYLLDQAEARPLFVTWDRVTTQPKLYAYDVLINRLAEMRQLPWDSLMLAGRNGLGLKGMGIDLSVHRDRGILRANVGPQHVALPWPLDGPLMQRYHELTRPVVTLWANTERVCVISVRDTAPSSGRMEIALFDKRTTTWRQMATDIDGGVLQLFGNWLSVQHAALASDSPNIAQTTGTYTFYALDRDESFVWHSDPHTEILGIGAKNILYRIDDELFEATFAEGQIKAPRLVCHDPVIRNVHWAFPIISDDELPDEKRSIQ